MLQGGCEITTSKAPSGTSPWSRQTRPRFPRRPQPNGDIVTTRRQTAVRREVHPKPQPNSSTSSSVDRTENNAARTRTTQGSAWCRHRLRFPRGGLPIHPRDSLGAGMAMGFPQGLPARARPPARARRSCVRWEFRNPARFRRGPQPRLEFRIHRRIRPEISRKHVALDLLKRRQGHSVLRRRDAVSWPCTCRGIFFATRRSSPTP